MGIRDSRIVPHLPTAVPAATTSPSSGHINNRNRPTRRFYGHT